MSLIRSRPCQICTVQPCLTIPVERVLAADLSQTELWSAGLYDSIPLQPLQAQTLDYADERLFWDSSFQQQLLTSIAKAAQAVEAAFGGSPQDIEGVYSDGKLTIVQSRPQVL